MCAYYDTILKHLFEVFCGSISYVDQEDGTNVVTDDRAAFRCADERTGGV